MNDVREEVHKIVVEGNAYEITRSSLYGKLHEITNAAASTGSPEAMQSAMRICAKLETQANQLFNADGVEVNQNAGITQNSQCEQGELLLDDDGFAKDGTSYIVGNCKVTHTHVIKTIRKDNFGNVAGGIQSGRKSAAIEKLPAGKEQDRCIKLADEIHAEIYRIGSAMDHINEIKVVVPTIQLTSLETIEKASKKKSKTVAAAETTTNVSPKPVEENISFIKDKIGDAGFDRLMGQVVEIITKKDN